MENRIKKNITHSRGFAVTALLAGAILMISVFFLFFAYFIGLKHYTKSYSLCYKTGARIQLQLKKHLKKLIQLNPKAKKLRLKRKQAQKALKKATRSGNSAAIAAAVAYLISVKMEQKVFALSQKRIFSASRRLINKEWEQLKSEASSFMKNLTKTQVQTPLAVKKRPFNSDSPDYIPVNFFSKAQNLKIAWSMNIFQQLPQYVKDGIGQGEVSQHSCSVSLRQRGSYFYIQLMK